MRKVKPLLLSIALYPLCGYAQNSSLQITSGTIVFEKKINLYGFGPVSDDFKRLAGQFRTSYFTLQFDSTRTTYIPDDRNKLLIRTGEQQAENNMVYINHAQKVYQTIRSIFGETFVVRDTLQKIKWKLTSEKKVIAGMECRRANAVILDSVYVVAFYTNAIPVSGGPELFSGLPGMILGVSLPHLHMNWFATKILTSLSSELKPTKTNNGQRSLTFRQYKSDLLNMYKSWENGGNRFLIQCLL